MDIKIARIFSAYGKGLRKQIFWDMYNKLKNTGRLDMFGTGNESRDYIHINDVIESLYLLATVESKDVIFNVANGEEVTIRQATEWFTEVVGVSFDKIIFNGVVREGDPLNWSADVSKIKALGYKKTVDMKDGLKEYYDWVDSL
jgi:nucleoside-diphosphate-sugar epimerase